MSFITKPGDFNWNPGADINGDDLVDILDLAIIAKAFGSSPGAASWNPDADVNSDGNINIFDLVIVARKFGEALWP